MGGKNFVVVVFGYFCEGGFFNDDMDGLWWRSREGEWVMWRLGVIVRIMMYGDGGMGDVCER